MWETWVATVRRDKKSLAAISGVGQTLLHQCGDLCLGRGEAVPAAPRLPVFSASLPAGLGPGPRGDPGDEARYLAEADLYVLTPQDARRGHRRSADAERRGPGLLREDDLPSPSGVVVLPRPLITRLPTRSLPQDIAYAWRSPWRIPLPESPAEPGAVVPDASPRWPWVSLVA
jgi:hypothetical protein